MSHRGFVSATALMALTLSAVMVPAQAAGPSSSPAAQAARPAAARKPAQVPRTPWGHPDLQGVWDFRTITPMERPARFAGKQFLTEAEAATLEDENAEAAVDRAPRKGDPGTYNQFWMDFGTKVTSTLRSSLIIDPPDGKIPPLAPEAKKRYDDMAAGRNGIETDTPRPGAWLEDVSLSVRCIVGFNSGPPMYPAAYNNNVQLVQTPDYVMIFNEMGPSYRIVPLDGRPHLPQHLRPLLGDSIGRWEGDTLVVDTTNFRRETAFGRYAGAYERLGGSGPNIHLVERFTRVDADTLRYVARVEDPTTWVRPWAYELTMTVATEPIYEYACHEANYSLAAILEGARRRDEELAKQAR
jgi:hypothetical protein